MVTGHRSSSGSTELDCKPCPREQPPRVGACPNHRDEAAARVVVGVAVALVDGGAEPADDGIGARTGSACASRFAGGPAYCAYASR